MAKETQKTPALNQGTERTFEFLKNATNNGVKATILSNADIAEQTNTPLSTIKRHLSALVDLGLIEVKTEFRHEYGKRCRLICIKQPQQAKKQAEQTPELSPVEQHIAALKKAKAQIEKELSELDLNEAKQLVESASFCILPGTEEEVLEAWDLVFDSAQLEVINAQLETGEYCDRLTVGAAIISRHYTDFRESLGFIDAVRYRAEQENPDLIFDGSSYENYFAMPEFQKALQNSLTEARYALATIPELQHGSELLPTRAETISFEMNGHQCTLLNGVWTYMRLNKLPPFNKNTPDYHFSYVLDAIRSLHWYKLTPEEYYSALGEVRLDCSNDCPKGRSKERFKECSKACEPTDKAQNEAHLRAANGTLAGLLQVGARAHEAHFSVSQSLFKDGVFKPVLGNEKQGIFAKDGLNKRQSDYLDRISAVFNYNINNIISTYNTGSHLWHLDLGLYDLRNFARKYSYGRLVPESCLQFDFRSLRLKLSDYVPEAASDTAIGSEGANVYAATPKSELKIEGLSLHQWTEFMWFEMAYRLFVNPERLLFGDLYSLKSDLSNLEQWLSSPKALAPGLVKDLYSFIYPEHEYEFFVYQTRKAFYNGANSGPKFVLSRVSRELTKLCVEHFTSKLFVKTYEDKFLHYESDKPEYISFVKQYARHFFNFLGQTCGTPYPGDERYYAGDPLKDTPALFEKIRDMKGYMQFNEVSFMMLKHTALFMLQNEHIGKWHTEPYGGSAAKYLYALASRPEDRALWQAINRGYMTQEVPFYDL